MDEFGPGPLELSYEDQDEWLRDRAAQKRLEGAAPALLAALKDLIPARLPSDELEDAACVTVLIPVYQLRAARVAIAKATEEPNA